MPGIERKEASRNRDEKNAAQFPATSVIFIHLIAMYFDEAQCILNIFCLVTRLIEFEIMDIYE